MSMFSNVSLPLGLQKYANFTGQTPCILLTQCLKFNRLFAVMYIFSLYHTIAPKQFLNLMCTLFLAYPGPLIWTQEFPPKGR